MIIVKTPLRISFCGGGTDLASFYTRHGGAVVSTAINAYVYICVNPKFDGRVRMSYSRTENVHYPSQLKHDLARACLEETGTKGVEITSISDIPGGGTGLGSSSSFTVGLLHALHEYRQNDFDLCPRTLAELAYTTEVGCGHPVGKQDHYAAAFGGLHFYKFCKDDRVEVEPICLSEEKKEELQSQLMLFYTGKTRDANKILRQQSRNLVQDETTELFGDSLTQLAWTFRNNLIAGKLYDVGWLMEMGWKRKKTFAKGITDPWFENIYDRAKEAGATGGKLCGAGGGGFFLFHAPVEKHADIAQAIGLRRVPFQMEEKGSEVIYGSTH